MCKDFVATGKKIVWRTSPISLHTLSRLHIKKLQDKSSHEESSILTILVLIQDFCNGSVELDEICAVPGGGQGAVPPPDKKDRH